ncbi:hypothetical protein THRCLA_06352 [Thraustotheca clavata]|uniref:Uncharacterized protein n=1 Tax=Thraustotheca clavata TaxID=74557 RepID=A0A1V9ZPF6_9STRA|nr:hypothetical protein THRCLA_06352 [Thraustotheca clavata]
MTVMEFEIGENGSCVPSTGGPGVGLIGKAVRTRVEAVKDRLGTPRSHEQLYLPAMTRIELLRDLGYSIEEIAKKCIEINQTRTERHETEQEYIAQMRQQQYEAHLLQQQMLHVEMQRQRQLYMQMHYQLQYQANQTRSREEKNTSQDNKRRRLSVEAMLN